MEHRKNFEPLPSQNTMFGFWGTCVDAGYDAAPLWDITSRFLADNLEFSGENARIFLDSRIGHWFADDLEGAQNIDGKVTEQSLNQFLANKLLDIRWKESIHQNLKLLLDELADGNSPKLPTFQPS